MFFLGLLCGVVAAFVLIWMIAGDSPEAPAPVPPRQSIHDIERQAIREMVATAMVNGQVGNDRPGADDEPEQAADET